MKNTFYVRLRHHGPVALGSLANVLLLSFIFSYLIFTFAEVAIQPLGLFALLVSQTILFNADSFARRLYTLQLQKSGAARLSRYGKIAALGLNLLSLFAAISALPELLFAAPAFALIGGVVIYSIHCTSARQADDLLKGSKADFLVHCAGDFRHAYQVDQWLPVFDALPFTFWVIVRNPTFISGMKETRHPVIAATNIRALERLADTRPSGILYPSNSEKNVNALRFTHLQHVFINHGESDKVVNQNKLLGAYDKLFLASTTSLSRLLKAGIHIGVDQAIIVGRPQTEIALERLETEWSPISHRPLRVLYAPTWEGIVEDADYTSVSEAGCKVLQQLADLKIVEVQVKLHPLTGTQKPQVRAAMSQMTKICKSANIKIWSADKPINELMNWSQLLVCDISSVLADYLYTAKPVLCLALGQTVDEGFLNTFPTLQHTRIISDPQTFEAILHEALHNGPFVLSNAPTTFEEPSLDRFQRALADLV